MGIYRLTKRTFAFCNFVAAFIGLVVWGAIPLAAERTAFADEPVAEKDELPQIIFLGRAAQWVTFQEHRMSHSHLRHEYVRQAFLMAARHDFGLHTRDAALGESMPLSVPHRRLVFEVNAGGPNSPNMATLFRTEGANQIELGAWGISGGGIWHYRDSVIELQNDARTKFVDGLKKLGYEPRPREINQEAQVPDDVRKLMREMNYFSQFEAVRRLHAEMEIHGDADQLLLAIARAYAHLGLLTEHHWHPAHLVFKARAALYGERLSARHRNLPDGYAVRGFALALAGCHRHAQEDMDTANAVRGGREPHEWEKLVRAYVHYNLKGLDVPRESDLWQLSQIMKCTVCENSGSKTQTIQTIFKTFEETEELRQCDRLHSMLCDMAGVALSHRATVEGPSIFAETLYGRVANMRDMPGPIKKLAADLVDRGGNNFSEDEFKQRRELVAQLIQARITPREEGEIDEFSFSVLGTLIGETSFVHVAKRVRFVRNQLGIPPDETIDDWLELIADHPLRVAMDAMCGNRDRRAAALRSFRQWPLAGLEPQMLFLLEAFRGHDHETLIELLNLMTNAGDQTATTLPPLIDFVSPESKAHLSVSLEVVSPHSVLIRAVLIETRPGQYGEFVGHYKQIAQQHAHLAHAVGRYYASKGQTDEALEMYAKSIEIAPEFETFFDMAEVYKAKKDFAKWRETLEKSLEFPDFGLNHARVNHRIAWYLIRQRKYDDALPYAERAGQSYSAWGLEVAGYCYEALGKFEEAEAMFRAQAMRYDEQAPEWAMFCRRTGFGDLPAAKELLEQFLNERLQEEGGDVNDNVARSYLILDQPQEAIRIFKRSFENDANPYTGLLGALLADREGNTQARDELLEGISRRSRHFRTTEGNVRVEMIELANLFAKDLADGGNADFDMKQLEAMILKQGRNDRFACAFFLGEYLEIHGKRDEALAWYARCAEPLYPGFCQPLAGMRLVNRGLDARQFSQHVDKAKDEQWLRE